MHIVIAQTAAGIRHVGPFAASGDAAAWLQKRPDMQGIVVPLMGLTGEFAEVPEGVVFQFGKYKGRTVESVMRENPQYITWAYKNIEGHAGITDEQYRKAGGSAPPCPIPMTRPLPPVPSPRPRPNYNDDFSDDDIPF